MRESFYATAATVIPVFFLAHAVLRSVAADLLMARWRGRYVLQGKILLAAIAACVLVPMAGEVAALMALTGIPSPYMMGLTWLGLGWSTATFAAISIAELWKLCRDREEKDPQTAIPSISAGEGPWKAFRMPFRMSKSDLQARPIYHRKRGSTKAHLAIMFAALAMGAGLRRGRVDDGPQLRGARGRPWGHASPRRRPSRLSRRLEALARAIAQPDRIDVGNPGRREDNPDSLVDSWRGGEPGAPGR